MVALDPVGRRSKRACQRVPADLRHMQLIQRERRKEGHAAPTLEEHVDSTDGT